MKNKKVTLFGDSLLKGVLLDKNNRYAFADINWGYIQNELGVDINNKSRFGCDVTKGQKIVNDVLSIDDSFDVAVVEYGGNDSDYLWDKVAKDPLQKHSPKTVLPEFEQKLDCIVKQLQNKGKKVVMMSLLPLEPNRYLKWISKNDKQTSDNIMQFLGDVEIIYRRQEMYSNTVTKVAYKNGCDFVDVRQKFLQSDNFPDLMCLDGIHANERGQQVIINAFVDYFKNTKLANAN